MSSHPLGFVSHGARFLVRDPGGVLPVRIRALLPPGSRIIAVSRPDAVYALLAKGLGVSVRRGRDEIGRFSATAPALRCLSSDFHFQVALHARRRLFVHAGTVAWQGRAIVLPGRTLAGKSTLVAALVREGATYFSDEYAVLDNSGLVHAYRKPINLRERDGPGRDSTAFSGDGPAPGPVPLGLVLATQYRPGARWNPLEISPGEALLSLLDNTVVARIRPRFAMNVLGRAVAHTIALEGPRGEAGTVAAEILNLFPPPISEGEGGG